LKVIGIWPFNYKVMDNRITPSTISTTTMLGNEKGEGEKAKGEKDYISGD